MWQELMCNMALIHYFKYGRFPNDREYRRLVKVSKKLDKKGFRLWEF